MELTGTFLWILATSSLWLAGSGLALWLCLRGRLRLSPGTRAAASILVVLQGWIWIGIPVELDLAWLLPRAARIPSQAVAASVVAPTQPALPLNSRSISDPVPISGSRSLSNAASASESAPVIETAAVASAGPPLGETLVSAVRSIPEVMPIVAAVVCAIWIGGMVVLLWRAIRGFVALSQLVEALPRASTERQHELSALCHKLGIAREPQLKVGEVAAPMLTQTLRGVCIVVPAWLWQSCTADQRRGILLHELAHHRRGDMWRLLTMRLLVLPHWFNPAAWWAARQFEAASEAACDDAACGGDPLAAISYSKVLLVLNETIRSESDLEKRWDIRYAPAIAISGSSLTERVRRLLQPEFQKESLMSRFLILSAMILLAGLATIRIQAADPSVSAKNEAAESEADKPEGVILRRRTITEEYEKVEPAKTSTESLLPNGGFEDVQENSSDPQAWFATRLPKTVGYMLMGSSKSVAHSGQRSVFVEVGENHPDLRVDYNWTVEATGWKAGEVYELSGWIKTENAKGPGFLMAQCWSEDRKHALGYSERPCNVTGTTDWTRVSTLLRVPAGTASVRIRAGLTSQDNKGAKAWLDDISLVKVSPNANGRYRNPSAKKESAPLPGGLLLANGGFEELQERSGDPQAWYGTRIPPTAGHFVLASSSIAHSGQRSAVVEIGDNHPDDRRVAYNWTAVAQGWKVGETYELSGWVKTEDVQHPAFVMAQFWNGEGVDKKLIGHATTQTAYPVKGTTDWTRVTTRLKVPEGTEELRIRAGLSSLDNRGAKAWLDDISLVKVNAN